MIEDLRQPSAKKEISAMTITPGHVEPEEPLRLNDLDRLVVLTKLCPDNAKFGEVSNVLNEAIAKAEAWAFHMGRKSSASALSVALAENEKLKKLAASFGDVHEEELSAALAEKERYRKALEECRAALYGAREVMGQAGNIQHAIELANGALAQEAPNEDS